MLNKLINHCMPSTKTSQKPEGATGEVTVGLAGNSNVGKSVIFNQLSGSNQIIGNWPGKTVERAEGMLNFEGNDIRIVDLPGIYSFSTYSPEEIVAREYIATEKPDAVINVVDASVLERNLFFTLQLKEMEVPLIICLNQVDVAKSKGIVTDVKRLAAILGVPVVPTVAVRGEGLTDLMRETLRIVQESCHIAPKVLKYGAEVETRIERLVQLIESAQMELPYPMRWLAIKLLEKEPDITKLVSEKAKKVATAAELMAQELEKIHGEPCFAVMISERYVLAHRIAAEVQGENTATITFSERLDRIVTHKVWGYVTSIAVLVGLLLWTFSIGNFFSNLLTSLFTFFQPVDPKIAGPLLSIIWNGVFGGIVAGVTLVIPFVIPFYLMLAAMEDSGILTRIAFMLDSAMHHMGLHGKAVIPLILGYGCNVPAIYGTRIMETRRERLLASFAITFAPCAARTIIVLGLVAVFVGTQWALALYAVDLLVMFVAAKVALRIVPGKMSGLIMEMHSFKVPSFFVIARQTWTRTKSIIYMVFPVYVIGTALIQVLYVTGVLEPVNNAMSFLTVWWLGLPVIAGILLIFGIIRKELILLTLVAMYGADLTKVLTPVQFIVLALVGMLYIPCIATVLILAKEFNWKDSIIMSLANLFTAFLAGGIAYRLLSLIF